MKDATPTVQELEIMKVVWALGKATVRDVYEALREKRKIAYTTVMTMMNILEQKGHLKKKQGERAYIYQAAKPRKQVVRNMVEEFLGRVFDGSAKPLLVHLVEDYDNESFGRVRRSLNLHGTAVGASDAENQLISLWSALEALLPLSNSGSRKRISQVLEFVQPVMTYSLFPRLIQYYVSDLRRWDLGKANSALGRAHGDSLFEQATTLLACDEYRPLRDELYAAMGSNPLLRHRTMILHEMMDSPEAVEHSLRQYSVAVEWNLRRVYRARNSVVHSGLTSVPGVDNVGVLHEYFDVVVSLCGRIAASDIGLANLRDMFWTVSQLLQAQYRDLAAAKDMKPDECFHRVMGSRPYHDRDKGILL